MTDSVPLLELFQAIESAVNDIIFAALAIWFAFSLETRRKRHVVLGLISQLRSLAHVIDMHQLTKDPASLVATSTASSPARNLPPSDLVRYLDYCSEMLSLTAKLAALYAEKISDPVVVDTVGDIERLTSARSSKIWQKISMVQELEGRDMPLPASVSSMAMRTT